MNNSEKLTDDALVARVQELTHQLEQCKMFLRSFAHIPDVWRLIVNVEQALLPQSEISFVGTKFSPAGLEVISVELIRNMATVSSPLANADMPPEWQSSMLEALRRGIQVELKPNT
jgi:hypothetical protein